LALQNGVKNELEWMMIRPPDDQVTPLRFQQRNSIGRLPAHPSLHTAEELQDEVPLELVGNAVSVYSEEVMGREVGVLNHLVGNCKAHDAGEIASDNLLWTNSQNT
jgi:hypothetical protein